MKPADRTAALQACEIVAFVSANIQVIAEQGLTGPELYALAQRSGRDWDDTCCPLCKQVTCDDHCPLVGVCAAKRRG